MHEKESASVKMSEEWVNCPGLIACVEVQINQSTGEYRHRDSREGWKPGFPEPYRRLSVNVPKRYK